MVVIDLQEAMKRVRRAKRTRQEPAIADLLNLLEQVCEVSAMALSGFEYGTRNERAGLRPVRELLLGARDMIQKEKGRWNSRFP